MEERELHDALMREQLKRELLMNEIGVRELRKQTGTAEERLYTSGTIYGRALRRDYVELIAEDMRERFNAVKRGTASQGAVALAAFKEQLPWEKVAHIALSTMLDCAGLPKQYIWTQQKQIKDNQKMLLVNVYRMLGRRLEAECRVSKLKGSFRRAYQRLKEECFTQHAGYSQKIYRIKRKAKDKEDFWRKVAAGEVQIDNFLGEDGLEKAAEIADKYHWDDWSDSVAIQLGSALAASVNRVTGWFAETVAVFKPKRRRAKDRAWKYQLFVFSQRFDELRLAYMRQAESFAFFELPMLVPPKNWTAEETGGWWFTAHVMSSKLIRGFKQRTMVSQKTLDFINTQQQIPFKINHFTLDVLKWMHQKGYSLGSFRTNPHLDPPPKPPGLEGFRTPRKADLDYLTGMELEELKVKQNMLRSFKRATTLYHDTLAEWLQLSIPIHLFFKVVDYVKDDPQFFFPWNLDWRTRCYPLVSMLSPQGPEYMKACLSWGEDHPLDKQSRFWMANNLGVAAGLSKRPYRERVRWVKDHMREVIAVATDPTGEGFEIWRNMDEPFVFLATAREYYECFIAKTKNTTNLFCCGHDATCSGLQLLGGMVKDKQTCSMVNCTGEFDTPQDAYGEVLAAALDILKGTSFPVDKIKGKRSLVKPAVMTKAYGAGHDTRVAQITDQLEEEGIKLSRNPDRHKELIEVLTNAVEQAMATVIPGADEILDWFQTTARKAYEELGKEYLLIESASGNVIGSEYRHMITKHVETETLGTTVYMPKRSDDRSKQRGSESAQVRAVDSEGDPDVESGILGIGANLTHGAGDAALLQLAFHDADFTFSTTHDCVYTPCTQAAKQAHMRVREAFIEICNYPTLQRYAALNGIQDMPPPIKGDYDPDDVLKSRYFFC